MYSKGKEEALREAREVTSNDDVLNAVNKLNIRTRALFNKFVEEITPHCSYIELQKILKIKSDLLSDYETASEALDENFKATVSEFSTKVENRMVSCFLDLYETERKVESLEQEIDSVKYGRDGLKD